MKYRRLGRTGLMISEVTLGTINFGNPVHEADGNDIVRKAHELGINTFDTADTYPLGNAPQGISEEILGKTLKPFRHEVVLSSKVGTKRRGGPTNDEGLSRYHIISNVEKSLRRLQTDYLDIYYAHIRDPRTPLDETLRAFDDLVSSGKVRYIGCSNYDAWEVCKALWISQKYNLHRFDCIQARYNLITRSVEREMLPFCDSERIGVFVYNPLAAGLLAGALYKEGGKTVSQYTKGAAPPSGGRFDEVKVYRERYWHERNFESVSKLQDIARRYGHTPVQLALAWLLSHKTVTSLLTSADFVDQVAQNAAATDVTLSDQEIAECNEIWEGMLPPVWSKQEWADITNAGVPGEFAF